MERIVRRRSLFFGSHVYKLQQRHKIVLGKRISIGNYWKTISWNFCAILDPAAELMGDKFSAESLYTDYNMRKWRR